MLPRVAHLISSSGFYGAERVVVVLSQAMRSAALAEPIIFSLEDSPDSQQEVGRRAVSHGIAVEYVRVSNRRLFHSVETIANAMSRRRIHIAHSHGYKGLILGHQASRRIGIPILATNHGWHAPTFRVRLYQRWEGRVMRKLFAVTAVAEKNAEQVKAAGVDPHRVELITNGVSSSRDSAPSSWRTGMRTSTGARWQASPGAAQYDRRDDMPVRAGSLKAATVMQVVLGLTPGGAERVVIELVTRLLPRYRMVVCCLDDQATGPTRSPAKGGCCAASSRPWLPPVARRPGRASRR